METCHSVKQPWFLHSFIHQAVCQELVGTWNGGQDPAPNPDLDPKELSVRKESVMQTSCTLAWGMMLIAWTPLPWVSQRLREIATDLKGRTLERRTKLALLTRRPQRLVSTSQAT